MKRRDFSLAATSLGLLSLGVNPAHAQARVPKAGSEYLVLDKRVPVDAPAGKVEVVEFFSYNCPHCNDFEPSLEAWLKTIPKEVSFRRIPESEQPRGGLCGAGTFQGTPRNRLGRSSGVAPGEGVGEAARSARSLGES